MDHFFLIEYFNFESNDLVKHFCSQTLFQKKKKKTIKYVACIILTQGVVISQNEPITADMQIIFDYKCSNHKAQGSQLESDTKILNMSLVTYLIMFLT